MGEQSQFHRRFFTSKSKRLKSLAGVNQHARPSNGLMSPEHRAQSLVHEQATPTGEFETKPKEVNSSPRPLSRQSAANGNFQESTLDVDDNPAEIGPQGDRAITGVQLPPADSSLSTLRHIDDDESEHEQDGSNNNNNDKQEQTIDIQTSEQLEQNSAGGSCHRDGGHPNDHIETLSYHPDTNQVVTTTGGSSNTSSEQVPQHKSGGRIRDSKLFKATKAILLFRRATSSLGHSHAHSSHTPTPNYGRNSQRRSFVSSFWPRQNTADNSTCTRSSRMDSIASSNDNNSFGTAGAGHALGLNGSGQTRASSSQMSLRHQQQQRQGSVALSPAASSSSFSLPRFIVPKMNALRLPIVCHIRSLEGELMREVFIHRYELGQYIMDNLKVSLDMKDAKYFGLKVASSLDEQEDVRQPWLDLNESVYKQISKHSRVITIKNVELANQVNNEPQQGQQTSFTTSTATTKSVDFYLRIKFYPPNLARIQDQFLKQYLWLQLRRDLRLGKLTSSMNNLTYLMACVLQHELGDYRPELVNERMPQLNVLPNQDLIEQQALEIWQTRLAGSKRHLVLMQFLRASVILETYGFDYYPVRDHQRQRAYLLGFNYAGVKTIRNGRIINHFRWNNLSKISHERRMIIFHIYPNENSKRKQILGFKCLSNEDCQNLYMRLLEQKYFFTVDLTYFDKSIRRPSHLTESAIGQLGDTHQQRPTSDWSSPVTTTSETRRQRTLDTDYSFGNEGDEEPEEEEEEEDDEDEGQFGDRTKGGRYGAERQETDDVPSRSHVKKSYALPGNGGCACAECKRAQNPAGCNVQANMTKSHSLQESSSHSVPADYHNQFEHYFSHPNSPTSAEVTPAVGTGDCHHSDPEPPTPRASHFPEPVVSNLQRQPSASKYTRGFDASPPGGSTDNGSIVRPRLAILSRASGDDIRGDGRTTATTTPDLQQTSGRISTGQRLVDWAEQVLTQPATLLASSSSQWPAVATSQVRAEGQIPGPQTNGSPRQPDTFTSVSGDLFLQAMRFCLLIVLMNILLRLSDGISNVLIDLLTFGSSSTSSLQAVTVPLAQQESPSSASIFGRTGGS